MKTAIGLALIVLGVALYQECEASTKCCEAHVFPDHFYVQIKPVHAVGFFRKTHSLVDITKHDHKGDGFDYHSYIAIKPEQGIRFKLEDVCFTASCISGFKVEVFNAHHKKLHVFKSHVDFKHEDDFHKKTKICLSDPHHQIYYHLKCLTGVKFIRVYAMPKFFVNEINPYVYYDKYNGQDQKAADYKHYDYVAPKKECKPYLDEGYAIGCRIFVKSPKKIW